MAIDVMDCTFQDLLDMECYAPTERYNGFVIVTTGERHDSGFGCMKYILLHGFKIVGVVGGWSDVVHLNGIGGYGDDEAFDIALKTQKTDRVGWSIDVMPNSGCVRLFCDHWLEVETPICSDFIIYVKELIRNRWEK